MRKSISFRPTINERLEDRAVPSGFGVRMPWAQVQGLPGRRGPGGGGGGGDILGAIRGDLASMTGQIQGSCRDGIGLVSSSLLAQDARLVHQAFQSLSTSITNALATLRTTATSTTPPTAYGIAAYTASVKTAIATLDAAIASALGNLPNTGPALTATIQGYTATLQSNLESAGLGLANSTSSALRATQNEVRGYIRTALDQSLLAIKNDQPAGTITSSTLQSYNQAVRAAVQTFNTAIGAAAQTAITAGSTLDSVAVTSAVTALQGSLTTAIASLGLPLGYDPTAAVVSTLSTVQTQLPAIPAPTPGNTASAKLFLRSIGSTVSQNLTQVNRSVATAAQDYNNSLL